MSSIRKITQVTDNRFLNMFDLDVIHRSGKPGLYHIASRARSIEELKLSTRTNKADGVIIYVRILPLTYPCSWQKEILS